MEDIHVKTIVLNSDFENGYSSQSDNGWIGNENSHVYQLIFEDAKVLSYFDNINKKEGLQSLSVEYKNTKKRSLTLIRLEINITSEINGNVLKFEDLQKKLETLKFKFSFWAKTAYSTKLKVHKIYITKEAHEQDPTADDLNVPSLFEFNFELDTKGEWKFFESEIVLNTKEITPDLYLYICLGYGEENEGGIGNFDSFSFTPIHIENLKNENFFNNANLLPIPQVLRQLIEDYLDTQGFSNFELNGLINEPEFSFSALIEIWNRESLNFYDLINFTAQRYPNLQRTLIDFLNINGINVNQIIEESREITLNDLLIQNFGTDTAELLSFYLRVLFSGTSNKKYENYLDSKVSEVYPVLQNLFNSLRTKTDSINQLRTFEQIELAIENYLLSLHKTQENLLIDNITSLSETKKINDEIKDSIANAIIELVDAGSKEVIPKFDLSIGSTVLPYRTRQKLNYLFDIFKAVKKNDKGEFEVDYVNWYKDAFGVGGGLVNDYLDETVLAQTTEDYVKKATNDGLQFYSTLDVNPPLKDYISRSIAKDFSKYVYDKPRIFKNLGSLFADISGSFLVAFAPLFGEGIEKDNFEYIFRQHVENITDKALKEGFVGEDGNYYPPVNMSNDTRSFVSSSAATAAYEGLRRSSNNLESVPTNIGQAVNLNPLSNFSKGTLGDVTFPNADSGFTRAPLNFYPSVPYRMGESLNGVLPNQSIKSLQNLAGERPELFKNSRFDGSFKNYPEFQNTLKQSGISDYRIPQINDSVNRAFTLNNLDKTKGFFPRLSTIGNEFVGNIDKRLGVPFNSNYSPFGNLLPLAAAPFVAGTNALGKSGGFLPGNQKFYDSIYGPQALASKNFPLPTNYSPEAMSNLLRYEAPFASPIMLPKNYRDDRGVFMPTQKTSNNPYSQFGNFSPDDLKRFQEYQKQNSGFSDYPEGYAQPQGQRRRPQYTKEQIEQFQKAQKAQKEGQYGQNRPKNNQARENYRKAREEEERLKKIERKVPVSGMVAGAILGSAVGFTQSAVALSIFGGAVQASMKLILGDTAPSKFQSYISGIGDYLGIVNPYDAKVRAEYNSITGEAKLNLVQVKNTWNKRLGKYFGYQYVIGQAAPLDYAIGDFGNGIQSGLNDSKDIVNAYTGAVQSIFEKYGKNLPYNANHGLLFKQLHDIQSNVPVGTAGRIKYDSHIDFSNKLQRSYYALFHGAFSKASYLEKLGFTSNIIGIKSFDISKSYIPGSKDYEIQQKLINGEIDDSLFITKGKRPSETFLGRNIFNNFSKVNNIRGGFAYMYKGFSGLASPLTGNGGILGSINYFFVSAPQSVISLVQGGRSVLGGSFALLPKKIRSYLGYEIFDEKVVQIGLITQFHRVKDMDGNYSWQPIIKKYSIGHKTKLGFYYDKYYKKVFNKEKIARSGITAMLFGKFKNEYTNKYTRGYFKLFERFSNSYSLFANPLHFLQTKLKAMLFNTLRYFAKKLSVAITKKVIHAITASIRGVAAGISSGAIFIIGLGCIFLFLIAIITMSFTGANITANSSAYGGVGQGGGGDASLVGQTLTPSENFSITNRLANFSQKQLSFLMSLSYSPDLNISKYSNLSLKYNFTSGESPITIDNIVSDAQTKDSSFKPSDSSHLFNGFETGVEQPTDIFQKEYKFDVTLKVLLTNLGISASGQAVFCTVGVLNGSLNNASSSILATGKVCVDKDGNEIISSADGGCPLDDSAPIACLQAGNGSFTHHNMRTKAIDIIGSGVNNNKVKTIVSGKLVWGGTPCADKSVNAGHIIVLIGDDGNWYYYYHTENEHYLNDHVGKGIEFATLYNGYDSGCWSGMHLHIEVFQPYPDLFKFSPILYPTINQGKKLNSLLLMENVWKCKFSKLGTGSNICAPETFCDPKNNKSCTPVQTEDNNDTNYNDNLPAFAEK